MNNKQYVPTKPIGCFLDYTYCIDENCQNECGRKISKEIKEAIDRIPYNRVSYITLCQSVKK